MKFRRNLGPVKFLERTFGWAARKCERAIGRHGEVITVRPEGAAKGSAVLSYHLDPWIYPSTRDAHYHTNRWECGLFGDTFVEAGYRLDVVEHTNAHFLPRSDCAFAFDLELNLERFAQQTAGSCFKIQHASTAHWLHYNQAELARLDRIRNRRGVVLKPRRQVQPNRATENADHVVYVGNAYTAETYSFAGKPMHRIPISTVLEYPWPANKNWESARRNFFWFGSVGLTLKGLDLALEAFARMPDLHLTVAGGIDLDPDFKAAYHRELFETPNIHTIGWVNILEPQFLEVLNRCGGIVYPSASEGGAGSVICCMHGGVLPIVTRQASVDVLDFGIEHRDDTIETIIEDVRCVSQMPEAELATRARAGWEHARRVHTRKNFRAVWRQFARNTLNLSLRDD